MMGFLLWEEGVRKAGFEGGGGVRILCKCLRDSRLC